MDRKSEGQSFIAQNMSRWRLLGRFAVVGAIAGFVVGTAEAALRYSIPRYPFLTHPDVRYVIWFVDPLANLLCFGSLGLALGVAAALGKNLNPRRISLCGFTGLAVAGAYMAEAVGVVHAGSLTVRGVLSQTWPWAGFAIVFAGAVLASRVWRRHADAFFDSQSHWPLGLMGKLLLIPVGAAVLGIAFYLARRPIHSAAAREISPSIAAGPNVVFITLDTVRVDHLSTYGYTRLTTPNLDRLAAQGVVFENAIAPSSWTIPSHMSMFTGLLPHQHGASDYVPFDWSRWTLAKILASRGYETAGFTANLGVGYAGWGMGQGFEVYDDDSSSLRHTLASTLLGGLLGQAFYRHLRHYDEFDRRNASEINRDILRWFRARSPRPYFLFVNYYDVHDPYWAPPPYDAHFGRISNALLKRLSSPGGVRAPKLLSPEDQKLLVAGYDNCLAYLDDQLGKLFQFLASSPAWSNTLVIITSDHGKAFGEHGHYNHGRDLYREMVHVPLIIIGPGIPAGRRIDHIASTLDIFSTVLGLSIGGQPAFGRSSLRRFWTPGFKPEPIDEEAVSELSFIAPDSTLHSFISLMTSEWHYIQSSTGRSELYRWPADAQEKNNLVGLPEDEPSLQNLRQRLDEVIRFSLPPWRGPDYLLALERPGYLFRPENVAARGPGQDQPPSELRVGSSQAYFGPGSAQAARPMPADEDLIRSLPYH